MGKAPPIFAMNPYYRSNCILISTFIAQVLLVEEYPLQVYIDEEE